MARRISLNGHNGLALAPVKYEPRDTVRDFRGMLVYVDQTVKALGFNHLSVSFNPFESHRFWLGGTIVELKTPDQMSKDFYDDSTIRLDKEIPTGYADRATHTGERNRVAIKQNPLGVALGVIGHEVFGHLMSKDLPTTVDDEAKAYAFQAGWNRAIQLQGIAGLTTQFDDFINSPVEHKTIWPDHDKAHRFVCKMVKQGYDPFKLHEDFAHERIWVPDSFTC